MGDNCSVLILHNKRPLPVIVQFWASILLVFLPNVVSPSNNTRTHVEFL